ncbi:MAG: enoyl-CoA hydratase/isomerase family protein [Turneriella sp.]|nr:enoyl-CoA hydratase/isomerase family protein [Turneriella sp.]
MEKIEISRTGRVSVLTIKTDEANRFDPDSFALLDKLLAEEATRDNVGALVLRSGVAGVFSQGLNLERLQGLTDAAAIERFLMTFFSILERVSLFPAPVVAEVGGHAMGYGAMLALASDYRLMVDTGARIGLPEIKIGIRVPVLVCRLLQDIVGYDRALKHVLDGSPWKSAAAHEIGLIDELHEAPQLEKAALKFAHRLAAAPLAASRAIKKAMRYKLQQDMRSIVETDIAETRMSIMTEDAREGIAAAVAGRRPQFKEG